MIRPTTKHQISRAQKRVENRARLLEHGWAEQPDGRWRNENATGPYSFEDAVVLCKLRGDIRSNSKMVPGKRGGGPNGCKRGAKGKWKKKA